MKKTHKEHKGHFQQCKDSPREVQAASLPLKQPLMLEHYYYLDKFLIFPSLSPAYFNGGWGSIYVYFNENIFFWFVFFLAEQYNYMWQLHLHTGFANAGQTSCHEVRFSASGQASNRY